MPIRKILSPGWHVGAAAARMVVEVLYKCAGLHGSFSAAGPAASVARARGIHRHRRCLLDIVDKIDRGWEPHKISHVNDWLERSGS